MAVRSLLGGGFVSSGLSEGDGVDCNVGGVNLAIVVDLKLPRPAKRISSEDCEEIESLLIEGICATGLAEASL